MKTQLEQKIGLSILENEPLKNHTTFRIGGLARFFVSVNNKMDLLKCLRAARELSLPFFILGGGSNVLMSDSGFDGMIIKLDPGEIIFNSKGGTEQCSVRTFAGTNLGILIRDSIKNNLSGLEFASNIPGAVGGAVWGNAGTNGKGVGDFVEQVEVIDTSDLSLKILTKEDCAFEYRDSVFKKNANWIVTEITFSLINDEHAADKLVEIDKEWKNRLQKQPLNYPSAGSVFKNVSLRGIGRDVLPEMIFTNPPQPDIDLKQLAINDKIPAGKLIEAVGLKGIKIGGAMISDKHANFIVNVGDATAADVVALIELAKEKVRERFGVELEEEIRII